MQKRSIVYRNAGALIPYIGNSRTHTDTQVKQIAASIQEFGFTNPILIDENDSVIAGHGRILAADLIQQKEVPCIVLAGLTKAQQKALVIADNQLALNAEWDLDKLALELESLGELDFDIDLLGFDDDFLANLLGSDSNEGLTSGDAIPEAPDDPMSVLGDLWILGGHRLVCGDCTDGEMMERLMDGQKADITFTSPPYNVGVTPNGNKQKYANDSDNKTNEDYLSLLDTYTLNCLNFSDFVFSNIQSLSGNKVVLIEHLYNLRSKFADTIIWDKKTAEPAMARRVLNSRFEYIHIFSNEAKRSIGKRDFRGTIPNIFELNSRQGKEFAKIHKATFPVQLPELFIGNFTESSCLDPFCGTGTTLIACEKMKRKCFGMELDPSYCDVIIKRWQEFTGEEAVHADTGMTYRETCNDQG